MVTQPVFDALFGEAAAARRNTVSQGMETVFELLRPTGIDAEAEGLDPFYASVRRRVQGASSPEACQAILIELYDKFFRKAFPRVTERLGIVYTPVEIVDFILHSVQAVLGQEFGSALSAPGVHILEPFTGTGTFIARMMQSELLTPEQIIRKYAREGQTPELHANEIVLLTYYIASVNIETAFQGATDADYRPFDARTPSRSTRTTTSSRSYSPPLTLTLIVGALVLATWAAYRRRKRRPNIKVPITRAPTAKMAVSAYHPRRTAMSAVAAEAKSPIRASCRFPARCDVTVISPVEFVFPSPIPFRAGNAPPAAATAAEPPACSPPRHSFASPPRRSRRWRGRGSPRSSRPSPRSDRARG